MTLKKIVPPFWIYYMDFKTLFFLYVESEYRKGPILSTCDALFKRLLALISQVLDMIGKNWIQIRNQHWKLHWKMVSNAFRNFFWVRKNGSWTFLRQIFNAIFNSKHISSSKHFSKMLLKATKGLWIDLAAILIHQIHSLFFM